MKNELDFCIKHGILYHDHGKCPLCSAQDQLRQQLLQWEETPGDWRKDFFKGAHHATELALYTLANGSAPKLPPLIESGAVCVLDEVGCPT